jgi:hypothetical protein
MNSTRQKLPIGISDFNKIISKEYYFVEKNLLNVLLLKYFFFKAVMSKLF